jgi:hypothetical protein
LRLLGATASDPATVAILVALAATSIPLAAGVFGIVRGATPLEVSQ